MPSRIHLSIETKQRPHDVPVVVGILLLLAVAGRGRRKSCGAMLRAREEVHAFIIRKRKILRSIRRRVNQRCRASSAPILYSRIRVEDLRLEVASAGIVERAFLSPVTGSRRLTSAKGNDVALNWPRAVGVAQRLFRSMRDAPAMCAMTASKDLAVLFVGIESQIEKVSKKSAALRGAEGQHLLRRNDRIRRVLDPCGGVAHCRESQSADRRIRRKIGEFVRASGFEAAFERDGIAVQRPLVSRDQCRRSQGSVANGKRILGRRSIARRVARERRRTGPWRCSTQVVRKRTSDARCARCRRERRYESHRYAARHRTPNPPKRRCSPCASGDRRRFHWPRQNG